MIRKGVFSMNKESFIDALLCLDRKQLAKYIRDKGKEPKMISPFVIFPSDSAISNTKKNRRQGQKC